MAQQSELLFRITGDSKGGQQAAQQMAGALDKTADAAAAAAQRMAAAFDESFEPKLAKLEKDLDNFLKGIPLESDKSGAAAASAWQRWFGEIGASAKSGIESIGKEVGDKLKNAIENPAQSLKSTLVGALETLGPFGVGLASLGAVAGAAGTALFKLADGAAETVDNIGDFATITGLTLKQTSELKYVTDITGESLDKMQGLAMLLERQMMATGASAERFNGGLAKLGISAQAFRDAQLPDQIRMLSEGFKRGTADGDTMKVVLEVLTRRGMSYVDFLTKDLGAAYEEANRRALKVTEEQTNEAERFQIAVNRLKTAFSDLSTTLGTEIVPYVADLFELTDKLIQVSENRLPGLSLSTARMIPGAQSIINASTALMSLADAFKEVDKSIPVSNSKEFDERLKSFKKQIGDLRTEAAGQAAGLGPWKQTVAEASSISKDLEESVKAQAEAHKKAEEAAKKEAEAKAKFAQQTKDMIQQAEGWKKVLTTVDGQVLAGIKFYTERGITLQEVGTQYGLTKVQIGAVGDALKFEALMAQASAGIHAKLTTEVWALSKAYEKLSQAPARTHLPKLTPGGISLDKTLRSAEPNEFGKFLQGVPGTLVQGLTGGGGAAGIAQALGSQMGSLFGEKFGKTIASLGNLGGPIGMAVGSLAGPLIGKMISSFGPSQKEMQGRGLVADFEKSFGGFSSMMAAVGDAYSKTGKSAQQAQADIKALLEAEKKGPAATQAWLDRIQATMRAASERTAAIEGGVGKVVQAFRAAGTSIPDSLRGSISDLRNMAGLTEAQQRALDGLLQKGRPNFEQLEGMASSYGITLEGLGPQFAQGRLEDAAKKIFDDFTLLKNAGADVGGVLGGMSDEISKLVQDSIKFGTSIPDNMKPLIDNLSKAGKLTDENGDAITDISKLSFEGTPLEESVQTLVDAIQDLVNSLNDIPSAAANAGSAVASKLANKNWNEPIFAEGAYTGAYVTTQGLKRFAEGGPADDIIPALLAPGELVLNRSQQRVVGALMSAAGVKELGGGGGVNLVIQGPMFLRDRAAMQELTYVIAQTLSDRVRMNAPVGLR